MKMQMNEKFILKGEEKMHKMRKWTKQTLACALAVVTLAGTVTITASAQKREFSFTAKSNKHGRMVPATKGDNEQAAYVTTTYHSNSQPVCMGVDNGSQNGIATTNWTFRQPTTGKKLHYYSGYADKKTIFYLYYETYGSGVRTISGRYNP